MPILGTKLVPEKFCGDFHKVKDFIHHYEWLCAQNNVTDDAENVKPCCAIAQNRISRLLRTYLALSQSLGNVFVKIF